MRAPLRLRLAFALGAALAAAAARPQTDHPGVCIAVADAEHAAAADAAQRTLGVPASRLDVRDRAQRAALASRCDRLIIAVGAEALRAADERAPQTPVVHVMAAGAGAASRHAVLADADPRRVVETLQRMAPAVRRIGIVFDPALTGELVSEAQASARAAGLELVALPVRTVREAVRAFQRFEKDVRVDALWLVPDGTATVQETVYYALELAHWRRMAVIGLSRWYVASGALFALLPTPESSGAAAGELAQQLLRGAPAPAAVRPREYALYVNQRTAAKLGLKLPRQLLESATQVLP